MLSLSDHFDFLLQKIEPDRERAEFARDVPALVRDYLKQHEDIETVEPYSRLAGSYARCTAIKNIKDVDLLLTVAAADPALLIAGAAVPPLDLIACLAKPVHQRQDDPAVVPDGMRIGEAFIQIAV